jgi:hypothetical protein
VYIPINPSDFHLIFKNKNATIFFLIEEIKISSLLYLDVEKKKHLNPVRAFLKMKKNSKKSVEKKNAIVSG